MRHLVLVGALVALLTGCGTVGGVLSGAGQDLQQVGDWIKPARK